MYTIESQSDLYFGTLGKKKGKMKHFGTNNNEILSCKSTGVLIGVSNMEVGHVSYPILYRII